MEIKGVKGCVDSRGGVLVDTGGLETNLPFFLNFWST